MGAHASCRLYYFDGTCTPDGRPAYARKPLRVFVDARPALLRYNQIVRTGDEGEPGADVQEAHGYFRREGENEYRQLTHAQIERVFHYVALHELDPKELTSIDIDRILTAPAPLISAP